MRRSVPPVLPFAFAALVPLSVAAGESVSSTAAPSTPAQSAPAPSAPLSSKSALTPEWNLRLRHEAVDDAAFARDADATTLRIRAGVRGKWSNGLSALVEGEGIAAVDNRYNSGANGNTSFPTVTDPEGVELNQAWVGWSNKQVAAIAGRQRLLFDNQRWIGNSGWRQNEQTFDALSFEAKLPAGFTSRYAWLDRVHRVAGDEARDPLARERDLDTHLAQVGWKRGPQQLTGYAWLHEDDDVPTASTSTFGVRSVTDRVRDGSGWGLTLELARQRDHAGNPLSFSHRYWLAEPSLAWKGVVFRAGWEHLGGDGTHALQTPLATLHAFNGWADKFNTTPPGGLDDRYLGAGGKLCTGRCDWTLAWHDYRADEPASGADDRYGREWNAAFAFPVVAGVKGLVKLADYRADALGRDTTKAWVQLEWIR